MSRRRFAAVMSCRSYPCVGAENVNRALDFVPGVVADGGSPVNQKQEVQENAENEGYDL